MKEQLANIRSQALAAIEGAADPAALDALRVQYLGKKGELTNVLKSMGSLSAEERPAMGQLANEVRAALESAIEEQGKLSDELDAALEEAGAGYIVAMDSGATDPAVLARLDGVARVIRSFDDFDRNLLTVGA